MTGEKWSDDEMELMHQFHESRANPSNGWQDEEGVGGRGKGNTTGVNELEGREGQ